VGSNKLRTKLGNHDLYSKKRGKKANNHLRPVQVSSIFLRPGKEKEEKKIEHGGECRTEISLLVKERALHLLVSFLMRGGGGGERGKKRVSRTIRNRKTVSGKLLEKRGEKKSSSGPK